MAGTRTTSTSSAKAAAAMRKAIPEHERHRRIAEAAYWRAEKRGFPGRDPLEDWLVAEAEFEHTNDRGSRARD
ncbi:MAG TPA: DUF2934 domain-containing protein [Gammaproteobacteria bacterium]|nr:DUF2934 domain-containing protein [Gammaproteobacteria bacterium]